MISASNPSGFNTHPQVRLRTPRRLSFSTYVEVDAGISDLILDVWDIDTPSGYCRTWASCQGEDFGLGYLMFQAGCFEQVKTVVEFYGHWVHSHEYVDNSVWPANTWECVRWIPNGSR